MTSRSRYAVPLEALEGAEVGSEDQVLTQPLDSPPGDSARWGGALKPAHGNGGGGGSDDVCGGDGD